MIQKTFLKIFFVLFFFAVCATGSAQESQGNDLTDIAKGRVVETDWVAGKLVIRLDDAYHPDQMTFFVDQKTKITKGTDSISLADILQSDYVTISYHERSFAGLWATEVDVRE